MLDNSNDVLLRKVAWIIGVSETKLKWDITYPEIIDKLVIAYEKLSEETEVEIYGK